MSNRMRSANYAISIHATKFYADIKNKSAG